MRILFNTLCEDTQRHIHGKLQQFPVFQAAFGFQVVFAQVAAGTRAHAAHALAAA